MDRIEAAKQRTKEELVKNLNSILDGGNDQPGARKQTWDVSVELSAPQILVPEHFVNKDALIMVLDLGKFRLTNAKDASPGGGFKSGGPSIVVHGEEDDEEDDEFVTPASSPGVPEEVPDAAPTGGERTAAAAAASDSALVRRGCWRG